MSMGLRWRWILEAGELEMENWSCGPGRSLDPHYRGVRRHRENDAKLAKLHLTVRDDCPAPSHLGKDTLKTFTTRHPTGRRGLVKTQLSLDPWTPRSGQSLLGIAHLPSTNRHIHSPYHIRIVTPPPSSPCPARQKTCCSPPSSSSTPRHPPGPIAPSGDSNRHTAWAQRQLTSHRSSRSRGWSSSNSNCNSTNSSNCNCNSSSSNKHHHHLHHNSHHHRNRPSARPSPRRKEMQTPAARHNEVEPTVMRP